MPTLAPSVAAETLAKVVEQDRLSYLDQVYSEIFPGVAVPKLLRARDVAGIIRNGLEPEEIVDLWNVVFPEDYNVYYDVDEDLIHHNEEVIDYVD